MRILLPYVQAEISFLLARAHEENIQAANMIQFINYWKNLGGDKNWQKLSSSVLRAKFVTFFTQFETDITIVSFGSTRNIPC